MNIINISHTAAPTSSSYFARNGDYAGFWLRLLAYLWDSLIIGLLCVLASYLSSRLSAHLQFLNLEHSSQVTFSSSLLGVFSFSLLYYTLSEASCLAATPGKFLMGLRVIDYSENQPSIGRALARNLLKQSWLMILSTGTLVSLGLIPLLNTTWSSTALLTTVVISAILGLGGHLMAGFSAERQALHDKANRVGRAQRPGPLTERLVRVRKPLLM